MHEQYNNMHQSKTALPHVILQPASRLFSIPESITKESPVFRFEFDPLDRRQHIVDQHAAHGGASLNYTEGSSQLQYSATALSVEPLKGKSEDGPYNDGNR